MHTKAPSPVPGSSEGLIDGIPSLSSFTSQSKFYVCNLKVKKVSYTMVPGNGICQRGIIILKKKKILLMIFRGDNKIKDVFVFLSLAN